MSKSINSMERYLNHFWIDDTSGQSSDILCNINDTLWAMGEVLPGTHEILLKFYGSLIESLRKLNGILWNSYGNLVKFLWNLTENLWNPIEIFRSSEWTRGLKWTRFVFSNFRLVPGGRAWCLVFGARFVFVLMAPGAAISPGRSYTSVYVSPYGLGRFHTCMYAGP